MIILTFWMICGICFVIKELKEEGEDWEYLGGE